MTNNDDNAQVGILVIMASLYIASYCYYYYDCVYDIISIL